MRTSTPPVGELYLEGLIDMTAKRGLTTLAVINEDTLYPRASARGTIALAKKIRERQCVP